MQRTLNFQQVPYHCALRLRTFSKPVCVGRSAQAQGGRRTLLKQRPKPVARDVEVARFWGQRPLQRVVSCQQLDAELDTGLTLDFEACRVQAPCSGARPSTAWLRPCPLQIMKRRNLRRHTTGKLDAQRQWIWKGHGGDQAHGGNERRGHGHLSSTLKRPGALSLTRKFAAQFVNQRRSSQGPRGTPRSLDPPTAHRVLA